MARFHNRCTGSRYRGGRRPPALLLPVILAALAVLALVIWTAVERQPAQEEPAVPVLAAAELPSEAEPAPEPESPEPAALPQPPQVHGIYISGPVAGSPYMEELTDLVARTELNTMVIDVKNDEGNLTYLAQSGSAAELGACVNYIQDLPGLIAGLKEQGIYTIARIAAFKDPVLAAGRPELALCGADGAPVSEGDGAAWVNPYQQETWAYLTEIALAAVQAGFDEVQFDYVRFPIVRGIASLDFGPGAEKTSREEVITDFLEYAAAALHEAGALVSADVFGTVIDSALDAGLVGQNYAAMAQAVDFICPMVYPSHYAAGAYGLQVPDSQPYELVRAAMDRSQAALSDTEEGCAGVRAWLQGFTATWVVGHITYGAEQLRAQIQAVCDAGYTDWIIWNANNTYSDDGLLPAQAE